VGRVVDDPLPVLPLTIFALWEQENSVQPGKRPLSFLLPTVVRPAEGLCGTYLALGANGAARGLSGLTQVSFPL
jgi:gamma-glutamyltranspeptidase